MNQYQLTLNDEQVQMLLRALDVYSRVGCGQFNRILEMFRGDSRRPEDCSIQWEAQWETLFCFFKKQLLSLQGNASYSICSPEVPVDYRLAWDVLQIVRHHVSWEKRPEGNPMSVHFDPPMNTSGLPFCTIVTVAPGQMASEQAGD
jgi:hypothetical protein